MPCGIWRFRKLNNDVRTEEPVLQWHPAFFAGIQIELREEEGKVSFESEHQLGTKRHFPYTADCYVAIVEGREFLVAEPDG